MLKIRLQRIGRKNDPSFRVVVTEHTRGPKSEKHVDRVGFYNPKTKEQKLDSERITHWIARGAQASGTVHNMLVKAGIIKGKALNVLPQKTPVITEKPAEEAKPEVAAPVEAAAAEEVPVAEDAAPVAEEKAEEVAPAEEEKVEEAAVPDEEKKEA